MDPVTTTPTSIKAQVITDNGTKHISIIIHDAEAVAEALAEITGHSKLAKALDVISKYADTALQGFDDAHAIEITAESIEELLSNVELDAPGTAPSAAKKATSKAKTSAKKKSA